MSVLVDNLDIGTSLTINLPYFRAGKAAVGVHLDVSKGEKLIQKLMIDEKKCYLFGRNPQLNDFCIDHASCSRVHATLVYHKHLNLPFLIDLGSTHGTHIGHIRLEANKPTQLPINSSFHFGASTRIYTIRERPQTAPKPVMEELERMTEDGDGGLLGLPETETELDNLTEFNTAHNRRISMLGIGEDDANTRGRKRHKYNISFKDEEDVINPEDIDPSIGKFRNLVQTTVVPTKKRRLDIGNLSSHSLSRDEFGHRSFLGSAFSKPDLGLYGDLPAEQHSNYGSHSIFSSVLSSKLGMPLPNPAPDVELSPLETMPQRELPPSAPISVDPDEPKKKIYAKEAWPGKKPLPSLLV